jgi:hypothetical protein
LDDFQWFTSTDGEVEVSDGSSSFVIGECGKQSGENDVKVDRHSGEGVLPFGLWERWKGSGRLQGPECVLEVDCIVLDHGPGALEIQ